MELYLFAYNSPWYIISVICAICVVIVSLILLVVISSRFQTKPDRVKSDIDGRNQVQVRPLRRDKTGSDIFSTWQNVLMMLVMIGVISAVFFSIIHVALRQEEICSQENDGQTSQPSRESPEVSNTITQRYYKQGNADTYIKYFNMSKTQHDRIYNEEGISPTLAGASKLSGDCTPKIAIPVLTPDRLEKRQNGRRFKENGDDSFTLTKQDIHGVLIQSPGEIESSLSKNKASVIYSPLDTFKIRRLTPIECERLQGFPDNWTSGFSDTQRYKMMGNAVTVNVIKSIIKKLTYTEQSNTSITHKDKTKSSTKVENPNKDKV